MGEHSVIGLIMATLLEAKPFIPGLGLTAVDKSPLPVFKNDQLVLVISGIGKAGAAMAACYACLEFSSRMICNTGAAGALDEDHPTGSIYRINKIIEHDRPDIFTGAPIVHYPDPLEGFSDAVLATGDQPIILPEKRKQLSTLAGLVDMEAASIVQACRLWAVPCQVFKFVSDDPGHTSGTDIVDNIRRFRAPFFTFFKNDVLPRLKATAN